MNGANGTHHVNEGADDAGANAAGTPIDASLLECSVCLQLLVEPLTLSCGHTFCRVCVVSALERSRKKCPSCRSPCHIDGRTHPENVLINTILKQCFPEQHKARLDEALRSREAWHKTLPIFFFNDVIFPNGKLSLHLFEPRYRLMLRRILDGNKQFCYLPNFTDYQAKVGDVGVVAQVDECEFLADGRALLTAKIISRVRVLEHWVEEGTQGLHYCSTDAVVDEPCDAKELSEIKHDLTQFVRSQISRLPNEPKQRFLSVGGEPPENVADLTFWVGTWLPLTPIAKYNLLKSTKVSERFHMISVNVMQRTRETSEQPETYDWR